MYQSYLEYWKKKAEIFKLTQPSIFSRISALPNNKYRSYKHKALQCYSIRERNKGTLIYDEFRDCQFYVKGSYRSFVPPRTKTSAFVLCADKKNILKSHLPPFSSLLGK